MGYIRLKNGQVALRPKTNLKWQEMQIISYDIALSWTGVVYGGDKFVALPDAGRTSAQSTDGITWTQMNMPSFREWNNVSYGNGIYVATSSDEYSAYYPQIEDRKFIARSTDGINWTAVTPLFENTILALIYANGQFFALSTTEIGHSSDGETWQISQHKLSFIPRVISYGNNKFIVLGWNTNSWAYSSDGINWTETTSIDKKSWRSMAYGNGKFVATASQNNNGAYLDASNFNN